jgi:hypothetical protein
MWIMTPRGFYSAVHKNGTPENIVTVRARAKGDLENLKDLLPKGVKPFQKGYSDYPWRIEVTREVWAEILLAMNTEITYDNFKDEVKKKQGAHRASVYGRIWGVLLALEDRRPRRRGRGRDDDLGSYIDTATPLRGWPDDEDDALVPA